MLCHSSVVRFRQGFPKKWSHLAKIHIRKPAKSEIHRSNIKIYAWNVAYDVLFLIVYIFLQHRSTYNGLTSIATSGGFRPMAGVFFKTSCEKWWAPGPVTWQKILWPPCPLNRSWWVRCIQMGSVWGQSGLLIHKSRAEIFKWERRCMVNHGQPMLRFDASRSCWTFILTIGVQVLKIKLRRPLTQNRILAVKTQSQNITKPNAICPQSNSESLRKWHCFCACFPCSNNSWQIARAKWSGPSAKVSAWNNCPYETGSILILSWKGRLCIYIPKD